MSKDFLSWLEERCGNVAAIESKAKGLIDSGGLDSYRSLMNDKAQLLADLAEEGEPYLSGLPDPLRKQVRSRLQGFASSANAALSLNSVFFMSALLYPEDHKEGQPNDLDAFREEVKKKM